MLSKEQTVSATDITLRAECYSYDPLPWNWDSTERWAIRYAYCGYDMIQAWDSAVGGGSLRKLSLRSYQEAVLVSQR